MSKVPKFELAELLAQLSDQLIAADRRARERGQAIMQLEECEVELAINMEGGGNAGIKFWVVELGVNAKTERVNTLKVKFKPIPGSATQAGQQSELDPAPATPRQTRKRTS